MAAKHLQRRSSSSGRNKDSGSGPVLQRPSLLRSSSFIDKREAQKLQDLPSHGATPDLTSRFRKSRSRTKSPSHGLNVTLGTVRELQTRLSCLEEQLTGENSDTKDVLPEHLMPDPLQSKILFDAKFKSISDTGVGKTTTTIKQGKGHYYGAKKGSFNFQPVARPPELGVNYHKEAFKCLGLNKEDISYNEDDLCGEGRFSQVFKGTFKGSEVAIKRLKAPLLSKDKNYFKAEVSLLRELKHPCVVELLGFCSADSLPVVVLEFMACGNLHSLLHTESRPGLSQVEFYQICQDVSSALLYLHDHQPPVLHLDLKPRNVLLSHGSRAKVADFGFSKLKYEADMKVSRVSKSQLIHSAPSWMAPELLAAKEVTAKADVYSFGILLWEMFTREIPYADCTVFQILEQVRLNQRPILPSNSPSGLAGFIQLCWDQNPAARPNFKV
ncbi:hypothetical protein EGW08_014947 [Elysia chlorotica]|uniref:Protein kinase domain-containing protein n=1 Tax=Elysia chlorotica TaxID=188477 RepID=A0A433T6U9_ELYCH|nr:hypothetical protein EGW08_014947 [Elysia chlorotica]